MMKYGDVVISSDSQLYAEGPATEKEELPNFDFYLGKMGLCVAERSVERRWILDLPDVGAELLNTC